MYPKPVHDQGDTSWYSSPLVTHTKNSNVLQSTIKVYIVCPHLATLGTNTDVHPTSQFTCADITTPITLKIVSVFYADKRMFNYVKADGSTPKN